MPEPTGRIFDIQRFCIHDGPGIRTTVFLQGCPLRCLWCHNPEGRVAHALLSFQADKCVGCGWCVEACEHGAHTLNPEAGTHSLNREVCVLCGRCVEQCYAGALELVGRRVTVHETVAEVLKDLPFYRTSGGGLTLSGGEPLAQVDFSSALLEAVKGHGVHCAVETCGAVPYTRLERVLPMTDLFLYDIKEMDPQRHLQYTGADNERIIANLHQLHAAGACIRVRMPVIPGLNDREDHFDAVAALVGELPHLDGVEIMPYHRLGTSKLGRFDWPLELEAEPPEPPTVAEWIHALAARGVPVIDPNAAGAGEASLV